MRDDLHEPRKHTKAYTDMVMRIIGCNTQLTQLIGEINALMLKYTVSPSELQRVMRFVTERHRWSEYSIRQGSTQVPKPKSKPQAQWLDDDDIEGEELDLP